jgi:hypothetical protein
VGNDAPVILSAPIDFYDRIRWISTINAEVDD